MDNVSAATSPCYVVRGGREGSRIYHTWEEVGNNVLDQPNASVHVFPSLTIAEEWLRNQEMSSLQGLAREPSEASSPPLTQSATDISGASSDSDDSDDADEEQSLPLPSLDVLSQPGANPVLLDSEDEEPQIQLSHEQRRVLDIAKSGRSIFFTGAAGTGKSVLLREIIRWGRSHYGTDHVAVTAPTGIAANNIGGGTIYSWAGIELGKEAPYVHMAIIRNKSIVVDDDGKKFLIPGSPLDRWKKCQMLVLDEVSMIDGRLIDKLEWLGRHIKRNDAKMWGGIQARRLSRNEQRDLNICPSSTAYHLW
ncbi:PIF1-like helicase-domain-containing protein [Irpex lacteus]|nr:PIF1-like helicase-domain-containing protein [Irpex lacteus]